YQGIIDAGVQRAFSSWGARLGTRCAAVTGEEPAQRPWIRFALKVNEEDIEGVGCLAAVKQKREVQSWQLCRSDQDTAGSGKVRSVHGAGRQVQEDSRTTRGQGAFVQDPDRYAHSGHRDGRLEAIRRVCGEARGRPRGVGPRCQVPSRSLRARSKPLVA